MPYKIKGKCIYKKDGGAKVGCTDGDMSKYLAALQANTNESDNKSLNEIRKFVRKTLTENFDYRGAHKFYKDESTSSPLYNLEQGSSSPLNFYRDIRYYVDYRNAPSVESGKIILNVKGKPDATVIIYRAVPKGAIEINPGDWITLSKSYAKNHGLHHEDPKLNMTVISKKVKAKEVWWDGNDVNEFSYYPDSINELSNIKLEGDSKEITKPYKFYMLCDKLCNLEGVEVKNKMIADATPVSRKEFVTNCAYAKDLFKYESNMADDPSHGFHKSNVKGVSCYYMQYAGFEFIFLKDYPTGKEYWLDEM